MAAQGEPGGLVILHHLAPTRHGGERDGGFGRAGLGRAGRAAAAAARPARGSPRALAGGRRPEPANASASASRSRAATADGGAAPQIVDGGVAAPRRCRIAVAWAWARPLAMRRPMRTARNAAGAGFQRAVPVAGVDADGPDLPRRAGGRRGRSARGRRTPSAARSAGPRRTRPGGGTSSRSWHRRSGRRRPHGFRGSRRSRSPRSA